MALQLLTCRAWGSRGGHLLARSLSGACACTLLATLAGDLPRHLPRTLLLLEPRSVKEWVWGGAKKE